MDGRRLGRSIRALRQRLGWRQSDLARRVGLSQSTISWIERGHAADTSLRTLEAIARTLDADIAIWLRWRGGDLDRLLDERHAGLGDGVSTLLGSSGWEVVPEMTYAVYGERGSIDLLGFHAPTASLLVVELKTELVSIEETLRRHDSKVRLAAAIARTRMGWKVVAVSRLLVLPDGRTPRRHVAAHAALLDRAYPVRTVGVRRWLRSPAGTMNGLLFLADTDGVGRRRRRSPTLRVRSPRPRSRGADDAAKHRRRPT